MIINNLIDKFDKKDAIKSCNSISSQYDKIIEIASIVFCSDKFDNLEKRELHLEIATNNLSSTQEEVVKYKTYDTLYEVGGGISSTVINKLR